MPDYGVRPPPYFSGDLPVGILGNAPYGWTQQPNIGGGANTPSNAYFPSEQFVYERMDWQKFKEQLASKGGGGVRPQDVAGTYANPPFMGAGQMTGPDGPPSWMKDQIGGNKHILRGYLRRQQIIPGKQESYVRLYFMYNPDQVQRQYLSWDESPTLDAQGGNGQESDASPITSPYMTTLSFTLYFDRQMEVANIVDHPGVMVDLQTFDVLSGQMVFGSSTDGTTTVLTPGMAIPANTDMTNNIAGMLQPKLGNLADTLVTAVFSPTLAVEGILSGAQVNFTKFSMRMTPMTMALTITLRVSYVGKNNNQAVSNADLGAGTLQHPEVYNPTNPNFVMPTTQSARNTATATGAAAAVEWGFANLMDSGDDGHYDNSDKRDVGAPCSATKPFFTDSASFVWRSLTAVGWAGDSVGDPLGLGGSCTAGSAHAGDFVSAIRSHDRGDGRRWHAWVDKGNEDPPGDVSNASGTPKKDYTVAAEMFKDLRKGDILVRPPGSGKDSGAVAFFYGATGDLTGANWGKNTIQLLLSPGDDKKTYKLGGVVQDASMDDIWNDYNIWARPEPFGPTTDGYLGLTGSANAPTSGGGDAGVLDRSQVVDAATGMTTKDSPDPIQLSPAALPAFQKWRADWGGPIPCTTGWRSAAVQQAGYDKDPKGHAPPDKSFHCKGLAVDVDNNWLQALPADQQTKLRRAAAANGWGQARWRLERGSYPGYEAPCNAQNGNNTDEPWHFSWGGCG